MRAEQHRDPKTDRVVTGREQRARPLEVIGRRSVVPRTELTSPRAGGLAQEGLDDQRQLRFDDEQGDSVYEGTHVFNTIMMSEPHLTLTSPTYRSLTSNVMQRDHDSGDDLPRLAESSQAELLVGPNTCRASQGVNRRSDPAAL
ncbi:hypothetical protein EYF80_059845 [Liparis tanakae]|uniref:Uncharacterized protein n=1 Tax=Liparis tanakae TaxID=230148 RepID=A0A4Z2EM87_9TELE|nr:hypothetical protein EYF80_059845 [Liparis tanakae]